MNQQGNFRHLNEFKIEHHVANLNEAQREMLYPAAVTIGVSHVMTVACWTDVA